MTKGFVTIATGSEKYYKIAENLVISCKLTNPNRKFAIITDKNNTHTELFDDVMIIDNPKNSYLDKIELLLNTPYDYNLFIDADCLVYQSLEDVWNKFGESEFSAFAEKLPLSNREDGWFINDDLGKYKDKVYYITRLNGTVYFIKNCDFCKEMHKLCLELLNDYSNYNFKIFEKPADEPIIALAMALKNADVIGMQNSSIGVYPFIKGTVKTNYMNNTFTVYSKYNNEINYYSLLHFGFENTKKPFYKAEIKRIKSIYYNKRSNYKFWYFFYSINHGLYSFFVKKLYKRFVKRVFRKIFIHQLKNNKNNANTKLN